MKSFLKTFLHVVLSLAVIGSVGFSYMEISGAKVRFGNKYIQDSSYYVTTNGALKTQKIHSDTGEIGGVTIVNSTVASPNGYTFASANNSIDDDANDIIYAVANNGIHKFLTGVNEIFTIDSNKISTKNIIPFLDGAYKIGTYNLTYDSIFSDVISAHKWVSNTDAVEINGTDINLVGNTSFSGGLVQTDSITVANKIESSSGFFIYFGSEFSDGSWRIGRNANNLLIQRRESASWVTKQTFTP